MLKFLGKMIGIFFVLGLLLSPATVFYFTSRDSFRALLYEGRESAVIEKCVSISTKGSRKKRGSHRRYKRVPEARTETGHIIQGTVDEIRFFMPCSDQVGRKVEVIYDLKKPGIAKINTLLEMWFFPMLYGVFCVIWYPLIIRGYFRKKRQNKNGGSNFYSFT